MRKQILQIVVAILLVIAGYMLGHHTTVIVHAQATAHAPRAWGKVAGTENTGVVFEDSAGTLRLVSFDGNSPVLIMTRQ